MIKYPGMRNTLLFCIRALADPIYQRRVWIEQQSPCPNFCGSLGLVLESLYNDLSLDLIPPVQQIGGFLCDENEAEILAKLLQVLDNIPSDWMEKRHTLQGQALIIRHPYWQIIMEAAAGLYAALTDGQSALGMFEDLQKGWLD